MKEYKEHLKSGQLNLVQITASDCVIVLKGFSVKAVLLCNVLQELLRLLRSKNTMVVNEQDEASQMR